MARPRADRSGPEEPTQRPSAPETDAALEHWEAVALDEAMSGPSGEAAPVAREAPVREAPRPGSPGARPRLVVYDFESAFDGGVLGAKVADVLTGHAARSGRFQTFPEVEQEAILARRPFRASYDAEMDALAAHARDAFGAGIAIWGRVAGSRESPVLDVLALDLRNEKESLVLRERYPCPNLHYIPMAAERILASCLGIEHREEEPPRTVAVLSGNLLGNGGFEKGLAPWSISDAASRTGVAVRGGAAVFELERGVAESTGLGLLSEYVPVEKGAHYECRVRVRSDGPNIIVWVKGYAEFAGGTPGERETDPRREVYRHQMYPLKKGSRGPDGWVLAVSDPFRPRHLRHQVGWMRVKLYAYLSPGKVEFDEVLLRKVAVEGAEGEDERMFDAFEEKGAGGAGE